MSFPHACDDNSYLVTHVTQDEFRLHFETEVALCREDGTFEMLQVSTPIAERRALRQLIRGEAA
ncbi:type III secretion system co-regulatory protein PtrC [Metapseudomonas otitidis]|uniref:type III secretion system co-regulatory protein PtrC n=1 Tax=Metapseudomonas otitidis TaxID=319939 RepID=UPI0008EBA4A7|nr:type III secretion system co-regulatory protein PtrC [Pseudomonas otitidis]SFA44873.1 hypothetical protein SAMN05216263_102223 [Pseudomonas otitidis]